MPASYPSAIKTFTDQTDNVDTIDAADINVAYDEIEAIETELGTNPKGASASVAARLDALDTTVAAKALTADLTAHAVDTTAIHGIVDTTDLVLKSGSLTQLVTRNFSDLQNKPTTLAGYGITDAASDIELSTHESDTTSVHGITDTAALLTTAHTSIYNHVNYDTAYTHSQDNTQAHSDYLVNNADDTTSGTLGAAAYQVTGGAAFYSSNSFFYRASTSNAINVGTSAKHLQTSGGGASSILLGFAGQSDVLGGTFGHAIGVMGWQNTTTTAGAYVGTEGRVDTTVNSCTAYGLIGYTYLNASDNSGTTSYAVTGVAQKTSGTDGLLGIGIYGKAINHAINWAALFDGIVNFRDTAGANDVKVTASSAGLTFDDTVITPNPQSFIQFATGALNPADATTYYFGALPIAPTTVATLQKLHISKAGTIKRVDLTFVTAGTLATTETSTINIRLNNTTDTAISSAIKCDAAVNTYSNAALSVAVVAGDYVELKWVTPTWVTDPTSVYVMGTLYIE